MIKVIRFLIAITLVAIAGTACAAFPNKPIRLIIGFPPGGGGDTYGRLVAQAMAKNLGQPVVVFNKPGAGGIIAADFVSHAPADGYTILLGLTGNIAVVSATMPEKLPYKISDFAPIGMILEAPMGLFVSAQSPYKTAQDFYHAAKEKNLTYGVTGAGGAGQLCMEMANSAAGVMLTDVPYQGSGPAITGLLGGQIDSFFAVASPLIPFVRQHTVRLLAISGEQRNPALPGIPTFKEVGSNLPMTQWYGLLAPAGTPKDVLARLAQSLDQALKQPEVVRTIQRDAAVASHLRGYDFMNYIKQDIARYQAVLTPEMKKRLDL